MDENTIVTATPAAPPTAASAPPTSATQLTDIHASKLRPDDPRLQLDKPAVRTFRLVPILFAAGALGALLVGAILIAFSSPNDHLSAKPSQPEIATTDIAIPDVIRDTPAAADSPAAPPLNNASATPPAAAQPSQDQAAAHQRLQASRQARSEQLVQARASSLFMAGDDNPIAQLPPATPPSIPATDRRSTTSAPQASDGSDALRAPDPNLQQRKADFLARAGAAGAAEYLENDLTAPRSPYEIKSGTVIPVVLISGINSDLPGQIIGQVRENVFDTVTGNYLLLPQGSRVLAKYDSMVAWGQERVLVCWNRVIRPDGTSISLDCMPGVDLAGYAGFADDVDNHWWKIASGAVLSSLLAATTQQSQGNISGFQPTFPQMWASGAAGQINQAGQQITAKNLQLQPTITVRPGFTVNILVSKDIILPPYHR